MQKKLFFCAVFCYTMPMKEITYGQVKSTLDFGEIVDQDGCMATHAVYFTHEGIDYCGDLVSDVELNGLIEDEEVIYNVYEDEAK